MADHIDEFVVRPAQRAALRKNVNFFFQKLQLPGLSVPLLMLPGEMKLLRRNGWVLSAVRTALQSMRCRLARAWIVRHLRMSFGKRGVWADVINAKKICRGAVVPIDRKSMALGADPPGPRVSADSRVPGDFRSGLC